MHLILPGQPSRLKSLLTQDCSEDLNVTRCTATLQPLRLNLPPVTYVNSYEADGFSLGVFLLKSGTCIPAGRAQCALGAPTGRIRLAAAGGHGQRTPQPEQQFQRLQQTGERDADLAGVLRLRAEDTKASGPSVLTLHLDSLHQMDAVDWPAPFPGILPRPYDPDAGLHVAGPAGWNPSGAKEASGLACDIPKKRILPPGEAVLPGRGGSHPPGAGHPPPLQVPRKYLPRCLLLMWPAPHAEFPTPDRSQRSKEVPSDARGSCSGAKHGGGGGGSSLGALAISQVGVASKV
ncbi:2-aminoethanethiol dioxygenase-like [Saccopteryx leptura]|uniref:2-aminoethanethiol dioxygenase-like n=1 Tax=Saccopteryx leptura TaxID=249018 RepID=UPI00339D21CB